MKKQLLLFPLWVLFSIISVFGQSGESNPTDLPTILPPSPTVTSLMRFEEVPIDNYSGKPNIVFPIYTKQLAKGVTIPIALRYNTMGLRIDERSGWTGTGWALDGEAVISRTVRGSADEINNTTIDNLKYVGIYHNGYYDLNWRTSNENADDYNIQKFLWNASGKGSISTSEGAFDIEVDTYQLSLYGKTAEFIIEKKANQDILIVKFIKNDFNLKINIQYDSSTFIISGFIITDTNGLKYFFDETEKTKTHNESYSISQNEVPGTISQGMMEDTEFVSAWKIKYIKINNENLVRYDYSLVREEFILPESIMEVDFGNLTNINGEKCQYLGHTPCGLNELDYEVAWNYNDGVIMPKKSVTRTKLTIQTKKVCTISFNDGVEIIFQMQGVHPEYQNSGTILENIRIKKNVDLGKIYHFNYDITPNARLFLKSITENNLLYTFTYNDKISLPRFGTKKKDIWGYFKDLNNNNCFEYPLSANVNDVVKGVLKKIEYPNGGVKEFEFESNTFSHNGNTFFDNDFFIKNNEENIVRRSEFILNFRGTGSDEKYFHIEEPQDVCSFSSGAIEGVAVCNLSKQVNGSWELIGALADSYSKIYLESGYYRLQAVNFDVVNSHPMEGRIMSRTSNLVSKYIYGGGLRIKKMSYKNINGLPNLVKRYSYHNNNFGIFSSNGVIDGFLTNKKEYDLNKKHILAAFALGNPQVKPIKTEIKYKVKKYLNNVFNSPFTSNSVGYSLVRVEHSGFSANGSSVFSYTTPKDYPTFEVQEYPSYPTVDHPINDKSIFQGKLLSEIIYDNNGNIRRETVFDYYPPIKKNISRTLFIYKYSCHYTQFYKTFQRYLDKTPSSYFFNMRYKNCANFNSVTPDSYTFFDNFTFNKFLLHKKKIKNYFYNTSANASIVENTENYTYNTNYLPSTVETTDSKGHIHKQTFNYPGEPISPSDFSSEEIQNIHEMFVHNMIDTPIMTKSFINNNVLSTSKTTYDDFFGLMLPNTIKTSKGNNVSETRIIYHKYDTLGNVLEVSKVDGVHVCYVWGYNKTKPVAKIENINYEDIPQTELDALNNLDYTTATEATVLQKLNALRAVLPTSMVTTMTYDPLVGVTSITDPKGDVQYYTYDSFNRLLYVKDKDGNILKENAYHYKNQ